MSQDDENSICPISGLPERIFSGIGPRPMYADVTDHVPEHGVQIDIRHDNRVVWVSVDGITHLRIMLKPGQPIEINLQGRKVKAVLEAK